MNDEWRTPDDLYKKLDDEFHFKLDAACQTHNCKCSTGNNLDLKVNALEAPWHEINGAIWLNPPYSRQNIRYFMKKAYEESLLSRFPVVCLVRDDPSAVWYKKWVDGKALQVRRLTSRVKFMGAASGYPFPCCIVVYNQQAMFRRLTRKTDYFLWSWQ